jgi:hypothetical protein
VLGRRNLEMKLQLTEEQAKKIDFIHKNRLGYTREDHTFVYVEELSGIVCMGEVDFNEYKYWEKKMSEPELKVGDKVKCLDNRNGDLPITIGKIYEIRAIREESFTIIDDKSVENEYKKFRFKPQFKVEKLGWYKSKKGDKVKILHKCKSNSFLGVLESDSEYVCRWFENGNYEVVNSETDLTLVEYLGPELPKEPRKFEFDAELESCGNEYSVYIPNASFEENEKNKVSQQISLKLSPNSIQSLSEMFGSKWHVTMTEILEE